jgi:hypothetical protein
MTSEGGRMCDIVSDAVAREYFYLRHLKEEGWGKIVSDAGVREYFYVRHQKEERC